MTNKYFNISSTEDISFTSTNEKVNIHLFTGQIVQISRDVLKAINTKMFPLMSTSNGEKEIGAVLEANAAKYLYRLGAAANVWPHGEINAPIWRASDGRVLPITEMDDRYVANAKNKVEVIARSYPNTKNIEHYKQWSVWFKLEQQRRNNAK